MSTLLLHLFTHFPAITLAHSIYRRHFHRGIPTHVFLSTDDLLQVQTFVELEGPVYRFIVVGQLNSFDVEKNVVRPFEFISCS